MPGTVICAPVRTAVGRYGGVFKGRPAPALGAAVSAAVVKRGQGLAALFERVA